MIDLLVTFGMICLFFLQGQIYEVLKKIIKLFMDASYQILRLFGIQIHKKEHRLRVSKKFKETFKDIRIVKKSTSNTKLKSSIHLVSLLILILSIVIVVVNLKYGVITDYLYSLNWVSAILVTRTSVDTTVTAVTFSFISLSFSKLISRWKETKPYRKAKKDIRTKEKLFSMVSSKDLLIMAKEKDKENLEANVKNEEI